MDRKAQNLAPGTIRFYQYKLKLFADFCEGRAITDIDQITPEDLRRFVLWLEETGHNAGGCHAAFRAVRTFLLWLEEETEPGPGWTNPIRRVKPPRMPTEPLDPIPDDVFNALAAACGKDFCGRRNLALIDFLLDTGARAAECLACNLADVNQQTGAVTIRLGKGRKPRTVYLGKKSRRALRAYLKLRNDHEPALWISDDGGRLTYGGLRGIIRRLSKKAGVPRPTQHDFRRSFALTCLRNGMDIFTLQILMGHADLQILRRYLKQTDQDTREAHQRSGPVDHLGKQEGCGD